MPENVDAPPPGVMPLIGAIIVSRLVYFAAELGIADLIARGSDTTEALAQKTRTHDSRVMASSWTSVEETAHFSPKFSATYGRPKGSCSMFARV